ncbi:MAG: GtrA family protein, partial [Syntrophobacteraceae bacterium]
SRSAIPGQMILFAMVGFFGTLVHYSALIFLVQGMHLPPVLSSTAGFLLGAFTNYTLNYRFTFCSRQRHSTTIGKFYTVAAVGMFLNGTMLSLLIEKFAIHYLMAQLLATAVIFVWNFFGNRFWTFSGTSCKK